MGKFFKLLLTLFTLFLLLIYTRNSDFDILIQNASYGEYSQRNSLSGDIFRSLFKVNRKILFISTTYRTGSTFLSSGINSHPEFFHHFEPLMRYGYMNFYKNNTQLREALLDILYLTECDYSRLSSYLTFLKDRRWILETNSKLARLNFTNDPKDLQEACNTYPAQVIKTVRMPPKFVGEFLHYSPKDFHLIYLIRDPRAIINSRLKLSWCTSTSDCSDIDQICSKLRTDLTELNELKNSYPFQVHVVKYEDLAKSPNEILKSLLERTGVSWDPSVQHFLESHTNSSHKAQGGYEAISTYRISKSRVDLWRNELSSDIIDRIVNQHDCRDVLFSYDYSI